MLNKKEIDLLYQAIDNARTITRKRRNIIRYKMIYLPVKESGEINTDELESLFRLRDEKTKLEQSRHTTENA